MWANLLVLTASPSLQRDSQSQKLKEKKPCVIWIFQLHPKQVFIGCGHQTDSQATLGNFSLTRKEEEIFCTCLTKSVICPFPKKKTTQKRTMARLPKRTQSLQLCCQHNGDGPTQKKVSENSAWCSSAFLCVEKTRIELNMCSFYVQYCRVLKGAR